MRINKKNEGKMISVRSIFFVLFSMLLIGFVQATDLVFSPSSQQVGIGVNFDVNISVSDVIDLYSYQFDLNYNPSVLQYVSASPGPFLSSDGTSVFPFFPNPSTPGFLDNFAATRMGVSYGVSGSGVIATIRFRSLSAGTSNLVFSNELLYDSTLMTPLLHTTSYGVVDVLPSSVCANADLDGYDNCSVGDTGDDGLPVDCNDNNPLINPGALENIATDTCGDGLDNDCDINYDWDTQIWSGGYPTGVSKSTKGDNLCVVDVYSVYSIPVNPLENSTATVYCNTSVDMQTLSTIGLTSVDTYIGNATNWVKCVPGPGDVWQGAYGVFTCPTGTPGTKTLRCEVNTTRSFSNIPSATRSINVLLNCSDGDGDGYNQSKTGCGVADCNDANPLINPGAIEICDGVDNNCVAGVDEGGVCSVNDYYCNGDSDGYNSSIPSGNCSTFNCIPVGCTSVQGNDCNDSNPAINPGATEICNLADDDCDTFIDEGVQTTYYRDFDTDTFGNPTNTTSACSVPIGYVADNTDCNDNDVNIKPSPSELICDDGLDNNCDVVFDCNDSSCSSDPACVAQNCTITSADWSTYNVNEGTTVILSVTGTNCEGQTANFLVWENDWDISETIAFPDDFVNINPNNAVFNSSGVATTLWTAEWQDDGLLGLSGDPEYYFDVFAGADYSMSNGLLSVTPTQRKYEIMNIPLQLGKNSFSLPVIPENLSVASVFGPYSSQIDSIYTYNGSFEIYYFDGTTPSNLYDLEIGRGYIVKTNQPVVIIVNGTRRISDLSRPIISLPVGWNLIGTFSNTYDAQYVLRNVNYSSIYTYNNFTQQFIPITPADELYGEKSYWIYVEQASSFVPLTGLITENDQ
jgi:hypothetical protein